MQIRVGISWMRNHAIIRWPGSTRGKKEESMHRLLEEGVVLEEAEYFREYLIAALTRPNDFSPDIISALRGASTTYDDIVNATVSMDEFGIQYLDPDEYALGLFTDTNESILVLIVPAQSSEKDKREYRKISKKRKLR